MAVQAYVYSMCTDRGYRIGCSTDPARRTRQVLQNTGKAWLHKKTPMRDAEEIEVALHQKYGSKWMGVGDYFRITRDDVDHEHTRMASLQNDYLGVLKTEVLLIRSGIPLSVVNTLNIRPDQVGAFDYAEIEKNTKLQIDKIVRPYLQRIPAH